MSFCIVVHLLLAAPFSSFAKHFLHILAHSAFGMPEVHLRESWRKYPSWYQTSRRIMPTLDRGGRDWDGHYTSSLAADAEVSTSERVERTERVESGGEEV